MIPQFNAQALFGASFLFRKFNEIDIYIEDTSNRAMFDTLIKKIVNNKYKVTRLHQLGGKKAVIDRCAKDQKHSKERKKIYLIDGDHDLMTGENVVTLKYLYSLKVYCIENLLLCKKALETVAHQDACDFSAKDIEAMLDIGAIYNEVQKFFLPLFVSYAIAYELNTGHETVSHSIFKLTVDDKGLIPDKEKIRKRVLFLKNDLISRVGRVGFYNLRKKILLNISTYDLEQHHLICAKTITLRLIFEKFKKEFKTKSTYDQFKNRLAAELDKISDPNLEKAILE